MADKSDPLLAALERIADQLAAIDRSLRRAFELDPKPQPARWGINPFNGEPLFVPARNHQENNP